MTICDKRCLDVSQGYASNRNSPFTTPNASPVKPHLLNPNNTPAVSTQTSPSIFRTEHEILRNVAEQASLGAGAVKPLDLSSALKKRPRDEVELSESDEESPPKDKAEQKSRRALKSLPLRNPAPVVVTPVVQKGVVDENGEVNPFLVPSSSSQS